MSTPQRWDGVFEIVGPGETFLYEFDAAPMGFHLYHCHSIPLKRHVHKGLYGAFIVDPPEGRPEANELLMLMNGFDTNFDGDNEVYAVNTVAHHYQRHPIEIEQGELVRVYLGNMTEFDLLNSFHLHGNFFRLYRTGNRSRTLRMDRHRDVMPGRTRRSSSSRMIILGSTCSMPIRANLPSSGGWGSSTSSSKRWFDVRDLPKPEIYSTDPSTMNSHDHEGDDSVQTAQTASASVTSNAQPADPAPSDGPAPSASQGRMALAAKGVLPLLLLAALLAVFVRVGPIGVFRAAFPPIEELTFERIAFPEPGLIRVHMVNGGPEPVTVAQVIVDDAYWEHTVAPDRLVGRLDDIVVGHPLPVGRWRPTDRLDRKFNGSDFHSGSGRRHRVSASQPVPTSSPLPF